MNRKFGKSKKMGLANLGMAMCIVRTSYVHYVSYNTNNNGGRHNEQSRLFYRSKERGREFAQTEKER